MAVSLVILQGKQKGREIPLPETIFLIGRDEQCHLRPHCETVSQLHCAIAAWGGKVRVRDLQSRNGTVVNGLKIRGEIQVDDGDELQIGTLSFRIKIAKGVRKVPQTGDEEAKWLLYSAADSPVLSPGFGTWLVKKEQQGEVEATAAKGAKKNPTKKADERLAGDQVVSAGEQLIAHIERQNRQRKPTTEE